jgi:PAS domain S-box-containing protein
MRNPNKNANGKRGQSDGGALQRHGWVIRAVSAGRLWAVWSVTLVVAAALLRLLFLQGLGTNVPYITFYPAVAIAALYRGLRAGFLTLALSAAVAIYFWVEPMHTLTSRNPFDWLLLGTFLTTTALISIVAEAMHRARARAHAAIQREAAALAQRETDERLRMALEQSHTGGWNLDLADHTMQRTLRHDQIFGYETLLPEWTYERFLEHVLPEDHAEVDRQFHTATATQSDWSVECRIRRKDGAVRWIWATGGHQRDATGQAQHMAGIVQDITERKQAEMAVRKSNRALKVISECNQVLVRATTEADLLQQICDLLVGQGGYRMAWVGFAEQDAVKSVRPAAQAGFEEGYLNTVHITWADAERGRGPTGTAIRTGQPVMARNIPTDPAYGPWRAAAIQHGYASSATLPLMAGERAFGAVMIYSGQPDAFDAEEIALLTELAGDLAYGITALRTHAERERADAERQKFVMLADSSSEFIGMCDLDMKPLYVNPAGMRMVGLLDLAAACQVKVQDYFFPEDQPFITEEFFPRVLREGQGDVEIRLRHFQTGEPIWMFYYLFSVRDASGEIVGWATVSRDITERRRAEEALRHTQTLLQSVTEGTSDAIYVKDLQGRYLMFNPAAARIVGQPIEEVLGRDDTALFAPDEARRVMEGDRRVMASGGVQTYEELVTSGGVARTYLSAKGPMREARSSACSASPATSPSTSRRRKLCASLGKSCATCPLTWKRFARKNVPVFRARFTMSWAKCSPASRWTCAGSSTDWTTLARTDG